MVDIIWYTISKRKEMTDQEIVEKVIEKAKKNGYKIGNQNKCFFDNYIDFEYPYFIYSEDFVGSWLLHINEIIFSHDFAKAFWKTERCPSCIRQDVPEEEDCNGRKWKDELQEMVLEKNPLKYLENFL